MSELAFKLGTALVAGITAIGLRALNFLTPAHDLFSHAHIIYDRNSGNKLNLYIPTHPLKNNPVMIFVHGGNWSSGSRDIYALMGKVLAKMGYLAVIPGYRYFPEKKFPVFVEDVAAAVKWVYDNIESYGGDKNNIFIMGHSAGAHIAALVAVDGSYLKKLGGSPKLWLKGMIGLAGPYDFKIESPFYKKIFDQFHDKPHTQPINYIDKNTIPLLLLNGTKDRIVGRGNARRLAEKALKAGANAKYVYIEGIGHWRILTDLWWGKYKSEMTKEISDFIRQSSNETG